LKNSIYLLLFSLFLFSCKTVQKPTIVTSKQEALKTGSYSFKEKPELNKPPKPSKKELKAIEKAKRIAFNDSVEKSKVRVVVEEETPQDFTPTNFKCSC
jgi:murein DD-endopeptidase / murein LD-carboxypeptidase